MQFNITFKTIFEYILKKVVLCIQIRFVSTKKNYAHRLACILLRINADIYWDVVIVIDCTLYVYVYAHVWRGKTRCLLNHPPTIESQKHCLLSGELLFLLLMAFLLCFFPYERPFHHVRAFSLLFSPCGAFFLLVWAFFDLPPPPANISAGAQVCIYYVSS